MILKSWDLINDFRVILLLFLIFFGLVILFGLISLFLVERIVILGFWKILILVNLSEVIKFNFAGLSFLKYVKICSFFLILKLIGLMFTLILGEERILIFFLIFSSSLFFSNFVFLIWIIVLVLGGIGVFVVMRIIWLEIMWYFVIFFVVIGLRIKRFLGLLDDNIVYLFLMEVGNGGNGFLVKILEVRI